MSDLREMAEHMRTQSLGVIDGESIRFVEPRLQADGLWTWNATPEVDKLLSIHIAKERPVGAHAFEVNCDFKMGDLC